MSCSPAGGKFAVQGTDQQTAEANQASQSGPTSPLEPASSSSLRPAGSRRRLIPGWLQAWGVFVLCQSVTTGISVFIWRYLAAWPYLVPEAMPYKDFSSRWDGYWYYIIATEGYPSHLPLNSAGNAAESQWAFYPVFPTLVRGIMKLTGADFSIVAIGLSVVFSWIFAVLLYILLKPYVSHRIALWSLAFIACFITAPVFQYTYTESMGLAFLVMLLLVLRERLYIPACSLLLLIGLSRPIGIPVAIMVAVHVFRQWGAPAWQRWSQRRRDRLASDPAAGDPADGQAGDIVQSVPQSPWSGGLSLRRRVELAMLLICAVVGAAIWPLLVAANTGHLMAYFETMKAWRYYRGEIVPVQPWIDISKEYFVGWFGNSGYWTGPIALAVAIGLLLWWLLKRHRDSLSPDLRTWSLAYLGYIFVIGDAITSANRYIIFAFPLLVLLAIDVRTSAGTRSYGARAAWIIARLTCIAVGYIAQAWWISEIWISKFRMP